MNVVLSALICFSLTREISMKPETCLPRVISFYEAIDLASELDISGAYSLHTNNAEVIPYGNQFLIISAYGATRSGVAFVVKDSTCLADLLAGDYFPVYDPKASEIERLQKFNTIIRRGTIGDYLDVSLRLDTSEVDLERQLRQRYKFSSEEGQYLLQLFLLDQMRLYFGARRGFIKRYGEWNSYLEPITIIDGRVLGVENLPSLIVNYWTSSSAFIDIMKRVDLSIFPLLESINHDEAVHGIEILE